MVASTVRDERDLFCQYRLTKDRAIREEIIDRYVYIAEIIAKRFTKNNRLYNNGMDYDDVYQVACLWLLYAAERYDPDKGV